MTSQAAGVSWSLRDRSEDVRVGGNPLTVVVDGKHFARDSRPYRMKGVTYGSFRSRPDGALFPNSEQLTEDLIAMRTAGLNTVRTYTLPPADLLDVADAVGLDVVVGLHYDDWRMQDAVGPRANRRVRDAALAAVDDALERCRDHRCVTAISVGNEVPSDLVRVNGIGEVEQVLSEAVRRVHLGNPDMLATYTNFPTTEYLNVEDQDFYSFNVFLERPADLRAYLRHLQRVAGNLPVVITELGLAERIHGEAQQARALAEQLRVVDETGCAGATVFAWTDEWAVADQPVHGWGFGVTDEQRQPKVAYDVVRAWAERGIASLREEWPAVSVVVCAYNEAARIRECLTSLEALDYPDLDVIVCDDGSSDGTLAIMREFPFRVLELEHGGLSAARNAGTAAAHGDIVAFLDADAYCHPEWPYHLAMSLEDPNVVATGGPNLPVSDAGLTERAVALSPGAPSEVLITDDRAEHLPGCNMAFRRYAIDKIGGFDVSYTSAGDDVDLCWRLLDEGWEIGFAAAAQVRHHRRRHVRGYLRQQRGYGRAERMVSGQHPHRFNRMGQARWGGFIYGSVRPPRLLRPVIYHGWAGAAPFQKVIERPGENLLMLAGPLLPLVLAIGVLGLCATPVAPLVAVVPMVALLVVAGYAALVASGVDVGPGESTPRRLRALVSFLHVCQPMARLYGRLTAKPLAVREAARPVWTGNRIEWIKQLSQELAVRRCIAWFGGSSSAHDLVATTGPFVRAELVAAIQWGWVPRLRSAIRPRPLGFLIAGPVLFAASVVSMWALLTATALLAMLITVETWFLKRAVAEAVRVTTAGAVGEK